jgi:uncharacterized membrane protein YkvI
MSKQFNKVWQYPIWLGLVTILGLCSALLGTGVWWVLSWMTLIVPLTIVIWKILGPKPAVKKR